MGRCVAVGGQVQPRRPLSKPGKTKTYPGSPTIQESKPPRGQSKTSLESEMRLELEDGELTRPSCSTPRLRVRHPCEHTCVLTLPHLCQQGRCGAKCHPVPAPRFSLPQESNRRFSFYTHRGVQPGVRGLHVAQDVYECNPTKNCKFT